MSLAKFLEYGNLTDFLKGELIATSPSPPASAQRSRSSSDLTSRSTSPERLLKTKTNDFLEVRFPTFHFFNF